MAEIKKSEFSPLIEVAFSIESQELLRNLFIYLEENLITENLEIIYDSNPEIMEFVIRDLISSLIESKIFSGVLTVINCPEDRKEEFEWFVKLFGYLESESSNWELDSEQKLFLPSEDHYKVFNNERINFDLDIDELVFVIPEIKIEFK